MIIEQPIISDRIITCHVAHQDYYETWYWLGNMVEYVLSHETIDSIINIKFRFDYTFTQAIVFVFCELPIYSGGFRLLHNPNKWEFSFPRKMRDMDHVHKVLYEYEEYIKGFSANEQMHNKLNEPWSDVSLSHLQHLFLRCLGV